MTIHELVELQRGTFLSQPLFTVDQRRDQLENLYKTIVRWEDAICKALESDLGKSPGEAYMTEIGIVLSEISNAIRHLRKWAKPEKKHMPLSLFPAKGQIIKEPYGVVLIIAPWNYPFQLALCPLVGALSAGNHCIVKPGNAAPATARLIAEMLSECFAIEQVAVVLGGRAENQTLLDERFDSIFFTGSVRVGRIVMEKAARYLTPVTLELGGKSPCIVDETANIRVAARRIAFGKGLNAGQTCVAPDYVLVQEKVMEHLMREIAVCWQEFYGNALECPQYPRMISTHHYDRVMALMEGEKIYCGGRGNGAQIEPTILTDVSWDAPVMQEEIFGPVLPVIPFRNIGDAIRLLQETEKPLALYLFTNRQRVKDEVLGRLSFGGGCVNDTIMHLANDKMPFGGVGLSGMGHYHGKYSFDTFTHEKSVLIRGLRPDIRVRYAPFSEKKTAIVRKLLK